MTRELIDRYALIKDMYEDGYSPLTVADKATKKVMAQPTVGRWIPCNEELPPKPERNPLFEGAKVELYLVSVGEEFYPFRAFWNGKDFTDGFSKVDAEAWMPLPEPYKAGDLDG